MSDASSIRVVVQEAPFDFGAEAERFAAARTDMGAVVTFTGVVRDVAGDLQGMEIEHYPGMTEKALDKIARDAQARWSLGEVLVIHRYGRMDAGERIMMVATAAPHRKDAFEAAEFLMDYLKSRAPFWKKESAGGSDSWVAAKDEDEDALNRW
ncbi:MAG: molybdenum cofactor biosynthesis protein MoaE [Rhodobacteraceae bacterium]|jgi:molybdopterin synthase catalytic subunit|uniref:Molybdopterin synthase catalytic subunit n=1 Tax=Salipiger profundus TaxID=1229727 RepID=A0A1U7D1Q6_9RHOB|nr:MULTISPECIES: molybdenum cofactor biosynthesis protein MoaE [Salipiger]APX22038.1 molybdopterin synthase subunit MoaE [Salipiger profundus]MAB08208.1 molybdenum cofactor biosynthesis protein MoaE [Paracoccaceae bacterium]GGA07080.1 molybdopterin synthase catalytic subunit [Salipiger profundus]SFC42276.1 molybdopterin synthase subunit MoaE [Salipiger profundus]